MKNIFTPNENYRKSAFLNWRIEDGEDISNMVALAEGFLNSSIELAKTCLNDNKDKKADMLIFPILNNANHGIELYLKSLIWTLNKLMNSEYKIEGRHNIKQMLQTVKSKIKSYKGKDWEANFIEINKDLVAYIDELFDLITNEDGRDNMDFSRYPITEKYENHFYVNRLGNVEIDLENFVLRFEKILEGLDERFSYFFYEELLEAE
tara:strand:- start:61 stop:681 length:621 start_codon:yes stop_codon:yes gene_type:complete